MLNTNINGNVDIKEAQAAARHYDFNPLLNEARDFIRYTIAEFSESKDLYFERIFPVSQQLTKAQGANFANFYTVLKFCGIVFVGR